MIMRDLHEAIMEFENKGKSFFESAAEYERVARNYNKDYTFIDKKACLKAARKSKEEAEKCIQIADWLKELAILRVERG